MFRSILRRAAESVLVAAGVSRRRRLKRTDGIVVLAYHNVIPTGAEPAGDRSLHLPLERFQAQMAFLQSNFDVIPLDEIGSRRPRGKPLAAITFDDAYAGALEFAIPELVTRGLPATVFVCPGLLGGAGFWWDRLSHPKNGLAMPVRERALTDLQGRQAAILAAFSAAEETTPWMLPGSEASVIQTTSEPGISLASHTWGHPNLATLGRSEVEEELRTSLDWLKARAPEGTLDRHLSFPYGLFNGTVEEVAFDLGFRYLYRVEGGAAGFPRASAGVLPRVNVPSGVSLSGFDLRASGVLA